MCKTECPLAPFCEMEKYQRKTLSRPQRPGIPLPEDLFDGDKSILESIEKQWEKNFKVRILDDIGSIVMERNIARIRGELANECMEGCQILQEI